MNPLEILEQAIDTTQQMIDAGDIGDAQRHRPTPCRDYDVDQLTEHIVDTHNLLIGAAGGQPVDARGR